MSKGNVDYSVWSELWHKLQEITKNNMSRCTVHHTVLLQSHRAAPIAHAEPMLITVHHRNDLQ